MKGSLAFNILTSMMADDWISETPVPSTSQDFQDTILDLEFPEVVVDPGYEEILLSLCNVDAQPDPVWTSTCTPSTSESGATSPPLSADGNSTDFLSDDSFINNMQKSEGLKVSLNSHIKAKRLASGQEEISLDEEAQSIDDSVPTTEEDVEQYHERKEKNRLAAQKCRSKKRERADYLEHDISRLESKQDNLKDEIQRLQDEHEQLQEVILVHGVVCPKIRKLSDS